MPTPEETRIRLTVELAPGEDTRRAIGYLTSNGANIIERTLVVPGPISGQLAASAHERPGSAERADLAERIGRSFPNVRKGDFETYARLEGNLAPNWISRLWESTTLMSETNQQRRLALDSINMYMVRQRVRQMENAESSFYRLGQTLWNTLAKLNNDFVESPEQHILPWDKDIHQFLSQGPDANQLRLQLAIEELQDRYREQQAQLQLPPTAGQES